MVGSVPLPDTESVLRKCIAAQPDRLKRIPDGETGLRNLFTFWQAAVFKASPDIAVKFELNRPVPSGDFTKEQVNAGIEKLKQAGPLETNYDKAAIQSYSTFKKLKDEGVVPKEIRFQVSIATAGNTLLPFVQKPFVKHVEPLYLDALYRNIGTLQESIPHQELAIQFDLAVDTALWDGFAWFQPWFGDGNSDKIKDYIVDDIVRMISKVEKDVEVGLHNCYGRHHSTPRTRGALTDSM
jgi:hypothetical protein